MTTGKLEPIEGEPPLGVETAPEYRLITIFRLGRGQLASAVERGEVRCWFNGKRRYYAVEDVSRHFRTRHADGRGFYQGARAMSDDDDDQDDDDQDDDSKADKRGRLPGLSDYGLASLVRELVMVLRETRAEKSELHRLALEPMSVGLRLLQDMLADRSRRVTELEEGWLGMLLQKEELVSLKHERDLRTQQAEAQSKRRDRAVEFLGAQLPAVVEGWQKQSELKAFLQSMPSEMLDVLREHGSRDLVEKLNSLVPKKQEPPANGSERVQ